MKNFDDWFKDLISDSRWYELLRHYREETIRKAAQNVFAQLVADNTVDVRPMPENRKHVYNILCKNPGDKVSKPWYVQEAEKKALEEKMDDELWEPVTGEERAKRLKEWEAIVKGSTMLNSMPKPSYKTLAEEGGVLPPKPAPYPCTSKEEAYAAERHFQYVKQNFEARTGQKLPTWICEEDWNIKFDSEKLNGQGK